MIGARDDFQVFRYSSLRGPHSLSDPIELSLSNHRSGDSLYLRKIGLDIGSYHGYLSQSGTIIADVVMNHVPVTSGSSMGVMTKTQVEGILYLLPNRRIQAVCRIWLSAHRTSGYISASVFVARGGEDAWLVALSLGGLLHHSGEAGMSHSLEPALD